ncbi:MAG: nucleoside transporter C-terminal domain-containing protein [Candidatus Marinimicrobia bacterium]|nr:nucleoside transporter C-terminal domain-containing protein [Candidatus Neomarinimicrobiota bacterium]MDD5582701.1 nucleoside transporter C-terminal domain-containing protein [Candidatus Neomarinimicrobiota bacterium]
MRFTSFLGIFILLALAWLLSSNKKNINWRAVGWGLGFQLLFALFVFVIPIGTRFFMFINKVVIKVLEAAMAGSYFVFGRLALAPGTVSASGETSLGYFLAFQALPTIIFFAALVAILYYLGIMNRIIQGFSYIFTKLMRISGAESCSAASNIFVGIESALVIKPYLNKMTRSELNTILTCGMATIASSMLAVYTFILKAEFPMIAGHLVSASIMNAPAAIIISKLLLPEDGTPVTLGVNIRPYYEKDPNLFASIINGANSGVKLVVGIVSMLIAFLGLVELVNMIIGFIGTPINNALNINFDWSLEGILGYLFYPLTFILGIPLGDIGPLSEIIGQRLILTEVTSFQNLSLLIQSGAVSSPRSIVITTYALTGFAHVASIAIFVGGISALVPKRIKDLSQLGFKALLGATLANLLTASVAGLFYTGGSILMP